MTFTASGSPAFAAALVMALAPFAAGSAAAAATSETTVRYVSQRLPVQGIGRESAAERPRVVPATRHAAAVARGASHWRLQAPLPGAVVHDLAFPTAQVGYAAAELGQVWKTSDGGENWTRVMDLGFPYYWYGIHAFNALDVVVSGFDNQAFTGVLRWSHDGGETWSDDVVLVEQGWSGRVRFAGDQLGLVLDITNFNDVNMSHHTSNGGLAGSDWLDVVPDPDGGWFGNQFSLLQSGRARASGITWCDSANAGADWTCGPAVDPVFDGPVHFFDEANGWVGGGSITPEVAGWLHHTADGGATWSGRTLEAAWPIREILFVSDRTGWAAGGNIYSNVGGMYYSNDGGETWAADFDSEGYEMAACAHAGLRLWCAGFNAAFDGAVYTLDLDPVFQDGFDGAP